MGRHRVSLDTRGEGRCCIPAVADSVTGGGRIITHPKRSAFCSSAMRRFLSLTAVFLLLVSASILYVEPHGRVAQQTVSTCVAERGPARPNSFKPKALASIRRRKAVAV